MRIVALGSSILMLSGVLLAACQALLNDNSPSRGDAGAALDGTPDVTPSGPLVTQTETLAEVGARPRLLAMNATHLFVVGDDEHVTRVNKATRQVEPRQTPEHGLSSGGPVKIRSLDANGDFVFITTNESVACGAPAVAWRAPTSDAGTFVELRRGCYEFLAIAHDDFDAVFALQQAMGGIALFAQPHAAPPGGLRLLTSGLPGVRGMSIADDIYVVIDAQRQILRLPKNSDAGVTAAETDGTPVDIVTDQDAFYWIETEGLIAKKKRGASKDEPTLQIGRTSSGLLRLAQDTDQLYFTNLSEGTVNSVPKTGGRVTVLASDQKEPVAITADATGIYWLNRSAGTLMHASRK
jgi:hypothetical protein